MSATIFLLILLLARGIGRNSMSPAAPTRGSEMPTDPIEQFSMHEPLHQAQSDRIYAEGVDAYFRNSLGTTLDKLRSFTKYVPRQLLTKFLANQALFQH